MISSLAKKITVYNLQLFFCSSKKRNEYKNHINIAQATNEFEIIIIEILLKFNLCLFGFIK